MKCADRDEKEIRRGTGMGNAQDRFLNLLYSTTAGRTGLKILTRPWISKLGGAFMRQMISI